MQVEVYAPVQAPCFQKIAMPGSTILIYCPVVLNLHFSFILHTWIREKTEVLHLNYQYLQTRPQCLFSEQLMIESEIVLWL